MNHTGLINYLADKIKAKLYLELGVQSTQQNFDKINVPIKVGVDPFVSHPRVFKMKSDLFFAIREDKDIYSLIFIDGLHEAEQVQRDFENSLKVLDDKGYIVLHDCLPDEEQYTTVPRTTKKWYGNVYLFCMTMKSKYDGIDFVTLNMDCGCMVVWKDASKKAEPRIRTRLSWDLYITHGKELLNVMEPEEFFARNIS